MPMKIVLAHGFLGFGDFLPAHPSLALAHYFNGVAKHLGGRGFEVIAPQVDPLGTVDLRSRQLAAAVLNPANWAHGLASGERVNIIAHSMGGLDARNAITHGALAKRVATLVTVGTPHTGSPVADAVTNPAHPLFNHIPPRLKAVLGALPDLTTALCAAFNARTPDASDVRYIEVAGDASKGSHELFFFQLAAEIGKLHGEINDGLVTRSSALRDGHRHLDDWPLDHAGEIGWSLASPLPIEPELELGLLSAAARAHLARYDAIVDLL